MSDSSYPLRVPQADRVRRIAAAVPTWAWLSAIVTVSVIVRTAISQGTPGPWIFDDELIYARLAESFGTSGTFVIRGMHGLLGYGPGYPILISPAYAIFHGGEPAYTAAKAINALLMSLAAVPAYLIARTVLGRWQSLVAAALALAIPSLAYTTVIMTENAFYPAFLVCALGFLRVLERPTLGRQAFALAAVAVAYTIRAQAVVLVAAFVTGILVFALLEAWASPEGLRARAVLRRLDAFRATWIAVALGAVVVVAVQAARGQPVRNLLGTYEVVAGWGYSVGDVGRWLLYHLAELDFYVGILPFAALLVVVGVACRRAGVPRAQRAFAAVAAPLVLWIALSASLLSAHFESLGGVGRIEERNVFYVAPLLLIALLIWVDQGLGRYRVVTIAAAVVAGVLPAVIPYAKFVNLAALSDTTAFVPLARAVLGGDIAAGDIRTFVIIGSLEAALIFIFLPRRLALLAPLLVLVYLVVWQTSLNRQMSGTASWISEHTITVQPDWIDDAVGRDADVAAIWTGGVSPLAITHNEFFNRSVDRVYALSSAPPLGQGLAELPTTLNPASGEVLDGSGRPLRSRYVLSDRTVVLRGRPVDSDRTVGLTVYRVSGPVRVRELVSGTYGDGWSGPTMTYRHYRCRPGFLIAYVSAYRGLLRQPQLVVAVVRGRAVTWTRVGTFTGPQNLVVPLQPRGGVCEATFTVSPTAVPADVVGGDDTRRLGVHFDRLFYEPVPARAAGRR